MSAQPFEPAAQVTERTERERLRAADPEALAALYRAHAATLLRSATALTGSVHDAEDIVQDLFVGLPEAIGKCAGSGSLEGWLRRVVVRMSLMRLRAGSRRREDVIEAADTQGHGREAESVFADRLTLEQALRALPDELRVIVVLKDIEGHSHADIARQLGIRSNTAAVRLHRARAVLRQILKEDR